MLSFGYLLLPRKLLFQQSPVDLIIDEAKKSPITVEKLRNNISMLQGSGGNIGVFNGRDGMLMIDAGIDVSKAKIKAALAGISDRPLKYLVNTHWHFDHTSGNQWLHKEGATLIAHANTRKNLSRSIRVQEWHHTFPPSPAAALPKVTFEDEYTLTFNDTPVKLEYMPGAHTDSDITVHFGSADILFTGDIWWNGYYPFIDADTKGNIKGIINAVNVSLEKVTDNSIIIPGHGGRGNKKQLTAYRDMLVDITEKISTLKKQGKTLEEIVAIKPTKAYDAQYGNFVINGDWFAKLVYQGL
jgi:glyoxylase-like metal-dependent hydrolase (beta-lactamase superfamily II)